MAASNFVVHVSGACAGLKVGVGFTDEVDVVIVDVAVGVLLVEVDRAVVVELVVVVVGIAAVVVVFIVVDLSGTRGPGNTRP